MDRLRNVSQRQHIAEQLDDRDADTLLWEATGHVVIVIPATTGPEIEGAGWYE